MFNDTSYEIAFDICVDSMVRMIEKYEEQDAKNEKKKSNARIKADARLTTPKVAR